MRVEHVAIWTRNLERLRAFYQTYFQADAGPKYANVAKQFESYFLTFASGARLELMQMHTIVARPDDGKVQFLGYAHLAFSVGSKDHVDALIARLQRDGYQVEDGPRWTGDGYYESRVLDCDGNRIEITMQRADHG
jgi:lactoylglutathione lyase